MSEYGHADLMRRIERMIVVATVVELNRGAGRARVDWGGGVKSDWLAIAQLGSNSLQVWFPPEAGTQVVVISPGGDTTKGIIYPGPFMGSPPAGNFAGDIAGVGNMAVTGQVAVTGDVTASVDVTGGGVSLKTHTHAGDGPGPGDTGPPA